MQKIRIGLFGFGKTGSVVATEFMSDPAFDVRWIIRKSSRDIGQYASRVLGLEQDAAPLYMFSSIGEVFLQQKPVDVIVDFSNKDSHAYYTDAARLGIKIVTAISNYSDEAMAQIKKCAEQTAILYSPNITIGINFLLVASQALQKIAPHADIEIVEEHFRDKPETSGTALKIAKLLGLKKPNQINSIRAGGIVGKHEIIFGLPNQTIRLTHESISRAAFGQGAIFATKWITNQPNGFYSMEKIIADMFKKGLPVY